MQSGKAPAWAEGARIEPAPVGSAPNASAFGTQVRFAGQPGEKDFDEYAKLGVKKVINLRMPAEMQKVEFNEPEVVKKAGMEYISVPFGPEPPTDEDLNRIYAVLREAGGQKVLLHCASSNRAGLAWSLFRASQHGLPAEEAVAEGKAAGLKSPALEKIAREKIAALPQ